MAAAPPLSQGLGYGIVLGLGFGFALGMMLITFILKRYRNEVQTSEMFSTAGRTVKSGLVASAVVSSWTWAATLLQSSGVAYRYGVSGPFWYASGATVQILLFATLAIELKRRAPNAHTFLEVIRARYGACTHIVFIVFGLMTNILVTAMLLTGGSAVVNTLTGMPTAAACFLLPIGVVAYTIFGGIKSTFITDYIHTVIILVIIFIFAFTAYATSNVLGSPARVYDLLVEAGKAHPVSGNAQGSYLTMRSKEGAIFFVINIVGNFGTVFLDCGYYNKAIAAHPVSALPGYVMGGLSWFAIPWLAATTMGLAALALETNPAFPTYPNRMSPSDAGVSMGYLYLLMGVIISSAVLPASLTLLWKDQNMIAAAVSPILGLATSLIAWLVTAKKQYGTLTVESTGANNPMLAGNVAALLSPLVYIPIFTYAFGRQNYDYVSMKEIQRGDDSDVAAANHVELELVPGSSGTDDDETRMEEAKLFRASRIAKIITAIMTISFLVLWPMPMYGTGYIFSKQFFTGWVVVGIIWLFGSSFAVGLYPLWEGRKSMVHTFKSIILEVSGKMRGPIQGSDGESEEIEDPGKSGEKLSTKN
ncbi:MAG: hypothetical protein M1819_002390 [Sarea resinae]|nr:MAG: hypothetical protein M1819_002390 [Sarea resinae]